MRVDDDDDRLLAARMRALAAFAPAFFHDLKGPLNAIVLRVGLLTGTGAADEAARLASLTAIEQQVRRLDGLLADWLSHSAPAHAPPADLVVLLQQCLTVVVPAARTRRCLVRLEGAPASLPLRVDGVALGTALLDLLRQALARIDAGSTLVLRVAQGERQARLTLADPRLAPEEMTVAAACLAEIGGQCRRTPAGDVEVDVPL